MKEKTKQRSIVIGVKTHDSIQKVADKKITSWNNIARECITKGFEKIYPEGGEKMK